MDAFNGMIFGASIVLVAVVVIVLIVWRLRRKVPDRRANPLRTSRNRSKPGG